MLNSDTLTNSVPTERHSERRVAMNIFGFGQSAEIDIVLNDAESRKQAEHKSEDGRKDRYFLFYDGETVSGKVNVTLKYPGKRLEHNGIKIEFVGQIGELLPVTGYFCNLLSLTSAVTHMWLINIHVHVHTNVTPVLV